MMLFCYIEEEIRQELAAITADTWKDKHKRELLNNLKRSEDILFHWTTLTCELDNTPVDQLLDTILDNTPADQLLDMILDNTPAD